LQRLNYFLLFLLVLVSAKLSAQVDTTYLPAKTYTQNQLLADFGLFRDILIEAHPSLYRYQTKAHFDSVLTNAKNQITSPMTENEFWRVLQPVIVSIQSGHTDLDHSTAQNNWTAKNSKKYLPYVFYVRSDSLYVVRRKKGDTAKRVYVVKSINGMDASQLITMLKKYVVTEGLNNQFAYYRLQGGGFSYIYAQIYGQCPEYDVVVIDDNTEHHVTYQGVAGYGGGVTADNFKKWLETKKNELNEVVTITYPPGVAATAVFKIKNFTYVNYYQNFHKGFFKLLHDDKINNLVIDIRGNTGGRNT
jgi:hypothetical protein